MKQPTSMPAGVTSMPLTTHSDHRGSLTEIIRNEWHEAPPPARWTVAHLGANALHGVHVHLHGWTYVCVVAGVVAVGLHDLRKKEPAPSSALLHLSDTELQTIVIPPGVAHGFYAPEEATLLLGASVCEDSDQLACRWDAPEMGIEWPCIAPSLSAGDRDAHGYAMLKAAVDAAKVRP